jgi:hypothetical protein
LQKVGERVAAFVDNYPNTTSTELVRSDQVEDKRGSAAEVFEGKFRYLVLRNPQGGWNGFQEYRTDAQGHAIDYASAKVTSILTSRFPLLGMYFDPRLQGACRYRYFGRQKLDHQDTDVVGFAQIPGASFPLAMFQEGKHSVQTLFQGLAWIEAGSHEILRLQTDLLAPPPDSSLQKETTRVDYAPVFLSDTSAALLLPKTVIVDVWLRLDSQPNMFNDPSFYRQSGRYMSGAKPEVRHYRNTHVYSDYKLFRVESRIGGSPP